MLSLIFKSMLVTSAIGGILTMLLLALKPVTKRCFGSTWQYYAWGIVLVVMMLPVTIQLPHADAALKPSAPVEAWQPALEAAAAGETGLQQMPPAVDFGESLLPGGQVLNILSSVPPRAYGMACYAWLLGLALMFGLNTVRYLAFCSAVRKNSVVFPCLGMAEGRIAVRKTNMVGAPLLVGVLRPMLLLPDVDIAAENLNYILLHEVAHYRRHDLLYKWFAMLVRAAHWFNPFVYIVSRQIDEECEASCDLSVAAKMSENEQNGYMNTILTLLAVNTARKQLLTTAMANDKKQVEKRFKMIRNATKKGKITVLVSAVAACIILTGSVFASGILSDKAQVRDLSQPAGNRANTTNVLFVGVDSNNAADAIVLLSLNRTGNNLSVLSIPRDTLIQVDGNDVKMSSLAAGTGDQVMVEAVRSSFGIPVDYYARVNFEGFRNIVDILGGVEFDVPMDMTYADPLQGLHISLKEGLQVLDGAKAEQLIRFRTGYPEADLDRVRMLQSFMAELVDQKLNAKHLAEIPGLYKELSKNIATDYPIGRIVEDINFLSSLNSEDIEIFTLPVELGSPPSFLVVNDTELKRLVEQHFAHE
ncbi:MAG: M56 family metallopeptidase/LCP family protein [Clostridiales bacterium]|nr:M56 family metallopeptidase/LCP family protein [Clostridiales bacterium]